MKKLGIVILNYLNYKDTIELIESLESQTLSNFETIIVDNASPNESYEELFKRYNQIEGIHLIKSEKNLGYAKGNNLGIQYCLKELTIYNVLIVNSDVIFTDSDYLEYLSNYSIGSTIGAVGTKITGSDGLNQNPIYTPYDKKRVLKDAVYFSLENWNITQNYRKIKSLLRKDPVSSDEFSDLSSQASQLTDEYFLHGSAIFLTENYLKQVNGFYPGTFLYYEENILAITMKKFGLKMEYTDASNIYHKEDQSSALSFGNNKKLINRYLSRSIWSAVKVSYLSKDKLISIVNNSKYTYQ